MIKLYERFKNILLNQLDFTVLYCLLALILYIQYQFVQAANVRHSLLLEQLKLVNNGIDAIKFFGPKIQKLVEDTELLAPKLEGLIKLNKKFHTNMNTKFDLLSVKYESTQSAMMGKLSAMNEQTASLLTSLNDKTLKTLNKLGTGLGAKLDSNALNYKFDALLSKSFSSPSHIIMYPNGGSDTLYWVGVALLFVGVAAAGYFGYTYVTNLDPLGVVRDAVFYPFRFCYNYLWGRGPGGGGNSGSTGDGFTKATVSTTDSNVGTLNTLSISEDSSVNLTEIAKSCGAGGEGIIPQGFVEIDHSERLLNPSEIFQKGIISQDGVNVTGEFTARVKEIPGGSPVGVVEHTKYVDINALTPRALDSYDPSKMNYLKDSRIDQVEVDKFIASLGYGAPSHSSSIDSVVGAATEFAANNYENVSLISDGINTLSS